MQKIQHTLVEITLLKKNLKVVFRWLLHLLKSERKYHSLFSLFSITLEKLLKTIEFHILLLIILVPFLSHYFLSMNHF